MLIYKIMVPAEWDAFEATGRFDGSPVDERSGFIHLSSRDQLARTAVRFFGEQPELVVVALDADAFGGSLRWEPASDGGVFPHVYGTLPLTAVVAVHRVGGAGSVAGAVPDGPA